jgi:hypothetical protein
MQQRKRRQLKQEGPQSTRLYVARRVGLVLQESGPLVFAHRLQLLERQVQARIEGRPGGSEPVEGPKRLPVSRQRCMPGRIRKQQRAEVGVQPPEEASRQFARRCER